MEANAQSILRKRGDLEARIEELATSHAEIYAKLRKHYENPYTTGGVYGRDNMELYYTLAPQVPDLERNIERLEKELKDLFNELKSRRLELQDEEYASARTLNQRLLWNRTKLVLIGHEQAGKTALVRAIKRQNFDENLSATAGVHVTEAKAGSGIHWKDVEKSSFEQELWFRSAKPYKPPPSLKQSRSFSRFVKDIEGWCNRGHAEMEQMKGDLNGVAVSIWDFGGHKYWHSLQHMFLTEVGVYLIVFDLSQVIVGSPRDVLEKIEFWLKSLKFHAPPDAPFLLVGTRLSAAAQDADYWDRMGTFVAMVLDLDSSLRVGLVMNLGYPVFLVDNESSGGVDKVRQAIVKTSRVHHFGEQMVSAKWMACLDFMVENVPHLEVEALRRFQRENALDMDAEELTNMLNVFHKYGLILYYTSNSVLSDMIVSDPAWVLENVKKAMFYPEAYRGYMSRLKASLLDRDLETLKKSGFASGALLESLWNNEQTEYLMSLMQEFLVLNKCTYKSNWGFYKKRENIFVVPNRMPSHEETLTLGKKFEQTGTSRTTVKFKYIPSGMFERIVCLAIDSSSQKTGKVPQMALNQAKIWLEKNFPVVLTLDLGEDSIEIVTSQKIQKEVIHRMQAILKLLNTLTFKHDQSWGFQFHMLDERRWSEETPPETIYNINHF